MAWCAVKESLRLLRRCTQRYGRYKTKAMVQAYHAHFRLWYYEGEPHQPEHLFTKKLFKSEQRLIDAICNHNTNISEQHKRLDPNLRGAYMELVNRVKSYREAGAQARKAGIRFRVTFTRFNEHYHGQKRT